MLPPPSAVISNCVACGNRRLLLALADATPFNGAPLAAGDTLVIGDKTPREEIVTVAGVDTVADTLTLVEDLRFHHTLEQADRISAALVLECYDKGSVYDDGAGGDNDITFEGCTANSKFMRIMRAAPGNNHQGLASQGPRFQGRLRSREHYFQFEGLVSTRTTNFGSTKGVFEITNANRSGCYRCIAHDALGENGSLNGFANFNTAPTDWDYTTHFVNCVAYNNDLAGVFTNHDLYGDVYVLSCTSVGQAFGFRHLSARGHMLLINCLATGASSSDFRDGRTPAGGGQFRFRVGSRNNASGDDTAPPVNARTLVGDVYRDASNDDYHLDSGAPVGNGTSLKTNPEFSLSKDLDDNARLDPWDIGADAWNEVAGCEAGDVDADGDVDLTDFVTFARNFTG